MTCSSIEHFNFRLNSELNNTLNSVDKAEDFLNKTTKTNSSKIEKTLMKDFGQNKLVDDQKEQNRIVNKFVKDKLKYLDESNNIDINKNKNISNSITESNHKVNNMNNGFSNGHDLDNLDFDLHSSNFITSTSLNSPNSLALLTTEADSCELTINTNSNNNTSSTLCVDPVSQSSSRIATDGNLSCSVMGGGTASTTNMGILTTTATTTNIQQKSNDISQYMNLYNNKAPDKVMENGQAEIGDVSLLNATSTTTSDDIDLKPVNLLIGSSLPHQPSASSRLTNHKTINTVSSSNLNINESSALRDHLDHCLQSFAHSAMSVLKSDSSDPNLNLVHQNCDDDKNLIMKDENLIAKNNENFNSNIDVTDVDFKNEKQDLNSDSNRLLMLSSVDKFNISTTNQQQKQPQLNFQSNSAADTSTEVTESLNAEKENDIVPKESKSSNDLLSQQQILQKRCLETKRRITRLQVQHTHRNLTKQMKNFVFYQQKLNLLKCQRFELDFSNLMNEYPENIFIQNQQHHQQLLNNINNNSNLATILKTNFNQHCQPQKLTTLNTSFTTTNVDDLTAKTSVIPTPIFNESAAFDAVNSNDQNQQKKCTTPPASTNVKQISGEAQNKILTTIGSLRYNLRHLETKYDSDATESSSGGESCDESDDFDSTNQYTNNNTTYSATNLPTTSPSSSSTQKHKSSIRNRSMWKWYDERCGLASRWSWLQAQITDLDTKLRKQIELFRDLRAKKGFVSFGENGNIQRQFPTFSSLIVSSSTSSPASSSINPNHTTATTANLFSTSQSQGTQTLSSKLDGNNKTATSSSFVSSTNLPQPLSSSISSQEGKYEESNNNSNSQPQIDEEFCMRTMPLMGVKRRKFLTVDSLSVVTKKAVKYSSIPCSCNSWGPQASSCVICNGRYNYMENIDAEYMPYFERVSLLDASCHPTLCLPNDVPLDLHIANALKRETFYNKSSGTSKYKRKKSSQTPRDPQQKTEKKKLSAPTKSKKKLLKSKKRRLSTDSVCKRNRDRLSSGCSSRAESPVPSPSLSEASLSGTPTVLTPTSANSTIYRRRRSEQHAFDINNIVIPYSIAATTRVERLQYKEIITPKWRLIDNYTVPSPENIKKEKNSNILEDISDTAFQIRHSKCETVERQRLLSYFGNQKNQNARKGARVRFDSKIDNLDQTSQDSINNSSNNSNSSTSKLKSKKPYSDLKKHHHHHPSISKSFSREDMLFEDEESVSPYEPRKFPLPDWLYENMLKESEAQVEEEENRRKSSAKSLSNLDDEDIEEDELIEATQHIDSTIVSMGDDISDHDDAGDFVSRNSKERHSLNSNQQFLCNESDDPEWKPPK